MKFDHLIRNGCAQLYSPGLMLAKAINSLNLINKNSSAYIIIDVASDGGKLCTSHMPLLP